MGPVFGLTMEEAVASPEALVDNLRQGSQKEGAEARSFFHQDVLKERRTEVDYINHLVSRKGREAGVPTPMNDAATEMVRRLTWGELRPDPVNIRQLEAALTTR
jgi:2-dehydropantoate 2-reductase